MKRTALSTAVAFLCAAVAAAQDLPSGTLLPIQLGTTIKAGKTKPGEHVSAKLAQYVVLNGTRIARGSQVTGRVIESQAASPRSPARIVLAFDSIRVGGRVIPVGTSLRAMASMRAVFDAELPTNLIDDYGSTIHDWNTIQVGGQGVYRGDGKVVSGPDVVAKASTVGEVFGKPIASPRSPCARDVATDREQSFWVFSTDACGLYGFEDLTLTHAGRTQPVGEIVLEAPAKLEVRGGSGLLLTVLPGANSSARKKDGSQSARLSDTIGLGIRP